MNKELQQRLQAAEKEIADIRNQMEKASPSAEQWLREYISQPFEVRISPGYRTYYLNGKWIFQEDFKNNIFWCYSTEVWDIFYDKFGMKYKGVKMLYKDVVLKAFNCEGFTTEKTIIHTTD